MKIVRTISITLIVALLVSSLTAMAGAVSEKTVICLDYGDVVIGDNTVSGYDMNGVPVKVSDVGYIIMQKDKSDSLDYGIVISSGDINVEILDINIFRSGSFDYAFRVNGNAKATLTLKGNNKLVPGIYRAGIDISPTGQLTINGDGYVYCESKIEAGIGGGNGKNNGTLIINSGNICAVGGTSGYGAGIGGSATGNGGNITINGGNVVAIGGTGAAGIGGGNLCNGGNIIINGGTITATGGNGAAGIGGGYMGNMGNVTINGGSVKATGVNTDNIGNGSGSTASIEPLKNSVGLDVLLVNIWLNDFKTVSVDGMTNSLIYSKHENDNNLYLYLTDGEHIATVNNDGSHSKYYKIDVENGTYAVTEVDGITFINSNYRYNHFVVDNCENYSLTDGFDIQKIGNEYSLMYNSMTVDEFSVSERGDVNLDGYVNSLDALIALNISIGRTEASDLTVFLADINFNGIISSYDALLILNKSAS